MVAELHPIERCDGVYVIVPVYNEAPSLGTVLAELTRSCANVVVVDDGSTDGSEGIARQHTRHVLRHAVNRGQGAALQTGIEYALHRGARVLVTFDADGQHRCDDVAKLVAPILRGECDITLGSRFLGGTTRMPALRRFALRCAVLFTRVASALHVTDVHNGLRAFSRQAAAQIDIAMDRMAHASELMDIIRRMGLPYREVPVDIRYTEYSLAKGQTLSCAPRVFFHYVVGRLLS